MEFFRRLKQIGPASILLTILGVFLLSITLSSKNTDLICEQIEPNLPLTCQLKKTSLLYTSNTTFELQGIRVVSEVRTQGNSALRNTVYWTVLESNIGDVHLPSENGLEKNAQKLEQKVLSFIESPQEMTPLTHQFNSPLALLTFVIISMLITSMGIVSGTIDFFIYHKRPHLSHSKVIALWTLGGLIFAMINNIIIYNQGQNISQIFTLTPCLTACGTLLGLMFRGIDWRIKEGGLFRRPIKNKGLSQ